MEYKDVNDYELLYLISENDEDSYNCIFYKYSPFIKRAAFNFYKKYKNIGIEYDDLVQEGMFGLGEALKKYNFREDNMFFTFATLCIKREMERLVIKAFRNKNSILTYACSLDEEISSNGFLLKDILHKDEENADNSFFCLENTKKLIDLKYELKERYAPVYELKMNGFTNKEIVQLLDLKYKDVDNYLTSIKQTLRKFISKDIE